MAVSSVTTTNMEALVDLFLSPNFHPFEPENQPSAASRQDGVKSRAYTQDETQTHLECEVIYESAIDDDIEVSDGPLVNDYYTKRYGQVLAKMGDEFYHSYKPKVASNSAVAPWLSISEKLRSVFLTASQIKDKDLDPEQQKEKAWKEFKEIISNSVSDTVVSDAYKKLGALLLTLHGLSNMGEGAKGLARVFFLRYIRDRQLDTEMQRLGGLGHLLEVD